MKNFLIIAFLFLSVNLTFAQDELKLAMGYYNSKEFDKAEDLFEKLYKQKKSKFYFDYYLNCLFFQEKYNLAEKKIKKEIKKHPQDLRFHIDLGYLKFLEGNEDEAEKEYKFVYKNLSKNEQEISRIANNFIKWAIYDWAEKVLIKGNKLFPGKFTQQLANVYSLERKNDMMIETYLDLLKQDSRKLSYVESVFLNRMKNDVNNEFSDLLERILLQHIQKSDGQIYEEMLIWYYVQKNQLDKALIYARALDLRNRENGVRVYRIGQKALENSDYKTANTAFSYVVDKGRDYPYYNSARFALLKVLYLQVENGEITTKYEIENLENRYLSIINEMGINKTTVNLIIELAHLQGFYLNRQEKAIELLKQATEIVGLQDQMKADLLLELGKIYLRSGKPWDAVLTFAKIEKDYPDLEITDNAKFLKAKTYFYLQEFEWAKKQFEVLQGSPSKLIANDAIYWTNFLFENSRDSTFKALKKFAKADYLLYQGKYQQAIVLSDSLIREFSADPIVPWAYHLQYEIYNKTKEYSKAAMSLEKIISSYSYSMWADKYVFELAQLYDYHLGKKQKAMDLYKKLLFDYKGSVYSERARKRYRELSGE